MTRGGIAGSTTHTIPSTGMPTTATAAATEMATARCTAKVSPRATTRATAATRETMATGTIHRRAGDTSRLQPRTVIGTATRAAATTHGITTGTIRFAIRNIAPAIMGMKAGTARAT